MNKEEIKKLIKEEVDELMMRFFDEAMIEHDCFITKCINEKFEELNKSMMVVPIDELTKHQGHMLLFASYGDGETVSNYSLECEDCQTVIAYLDVGEEQ